MSTLDKMLIKGIRSFSPDNTHVITFYKPLTLVVGPNGAGKTTIIEALKYGCTGELPPNSRSGQSFIHDPKVAGETETKGQIKLRFRTAAGKDVVCIRSFQLTQKASKMEYKAIESVLQTINSQTGEKVCLSYRCADIDREVPALMGVSKAILENVIFVHQDDANWPLSEPATLKKKFDDIFSATRYTKALEVLKKLHKEKGDEIKTYRLKLDHLQTLKDAAYKLKENIHNDQEKGAQLRSQIQELEKKIGDSQFRVNSLESILQQMKALQDDIRVKMSEREMVRQMKARQYADIEEDLEDTDQELAEWQANFSDKIKLFEKKKADAKGELASIDEMLTKWDKDYVSLTVTKSTLQAAEDAHLQQRKGRDNLIQELFSKYQLGGVGSPPFVEGVAASYVNRVTRRVNELKEDLSHLKDFNAGECAKIWKRYEDINHKYSEALAQSRAKEEEKIMLESTARDLNKKIEDSMFSEDEMMKFEEKANKLDSQIGKLQSKLEEQNFDSVLKEMQVEKFQLQKRSGDLRREQAALAAESEEHIALKMKKGELVNKERSLKNMMGDMKENIRKALKNKMLEAKDLKHEVEDALRKAKEAFDQVSKKSIEAEKEVSGSLSMLQEAKNNHAKLQRDKETKRKFLINKLAAILQLDIDLDSYPVQLQDAIEKKETRKSQHDMADGMRRMFEPFERVARSTHACPCCERPFSPEEEDDFVWKQRTKSSSTGERLRELASHCSIAESKVQNLEKLRPVHEEYQKIIKEHIPCQEQLIGKCKEEYELKRETSDELCTLLATCKMEHDMIADLTIPANTADRLYREIQVLRKEIQDNEDRINSQSQCLRSADELHHEIEQVEEKMESLDRRLQKLTETQMHMKDDLSHLQARCHAAKEDKMRMASKKEELKRWKDELRNIKDKLIENEARFQALYESKEMLQKDKDRILKEHDDLKAEARRQEDVRSAEMHKLELEADSLDGLHSQIQEYISSNQAEKLNATCAQLTKCAAEKEELAQKRIEKTAEISNTTELLAKQEKVKRNIEDNISYRQSVAKEQDLLGQVESLEQQLTTMGDESSLQTDVKKALGDKQASLSELNRNQGTLLVYDSNVARNKQELKQPQYKDIDKRYREQLIQLKTTEMANKDLGKYYNALDRALMRFHSMKMEEINKIIKELWQQTYRGQDIDFIEIRADAEGAGTRSYSYRVIMRTGDAELEMRGRCSAGQKVLAALIIRLALAETFCLNCGILALDEPTTNLDAQNSESLAAALLRIMEDRKGQENFQLIVITHDEKFAQLIGQRQLAERYYRVSKDDYQHSIIEAQEIYD